MNDKGIKYDGGKDKWSLLHLESIQEIIKVLMYGEEKYTHKVGSQTVSGADNWKMIPDIPFRYFNATQRHLWAWKSGERNDPESGLPHLAHAGCCVLFMLWAEITKPPKNDKKK